MSRVADILKMYQPPTANGSTRPVVTKKWPPVKTNDSVSPAVAKPFVPVKPTAKPKPVSSSLHSIKKENTQPQINSADTNDNLPLWKREMMKRKEQANSTAPEVVRSGSVERGASAPPAANLSNKKALFENKTVETPKPDIKRPVTQSTKSWKVSEPTRSNSTSSNNSVASGRNFAGKLPPSLPIKPKPIQEISKPSFLHNRHSSPQHDTSTNNAFPPPPIKIVKQSGPKRKDLPSYVYNKQPPSKPYRPPGVNINSFLHKGSPNHHDLPPPLPNIASHPANRPPMPIPGQLPPPSLLQHTIPPLKSPAHRPLPQPNLPEPPEDDEFDDDDEEEVYDVPPDEILPPPSPALPPRPTTFNEEIPTCDDSDDDGAVYDETALDIPPEQYVGGDGEIYESVEEYMRFKGQAQDSGENNEKQKKLEEKKRKESEKKEKKMRKDYNLSKSGEITAEAQGIVKSDVRGRGKDLSVSKHEKVEIIRMSDNPKGKWLVRNQDGAYGYVESSNVNIDVGILKSTMHMGGAQQSMIPTLDEEEEEGAIYDETPDAGGDNEDLYEEFDN